MTKKLKSKLIMKKLKRQNNIQTQKFVFYQNQALRIFAEKSCSNFVKMKVAKPQNYITLSKINYKKNFKGKWQKNISSSQTKVKGKRQKKLVQYNYFQFYENKQGEYNHIS